MGLENKPCNPRGGLHLLRVKQVQRLMWAGIRRVTDTASMGTSGMRGGTAGGTLTPGAGERHCSSVTSSPRLLGKVVLSNELQSLVCGPRGMESCWKSLHV